MNTFLDNIRAVCFDAVGTLLIPNPPAVEVYVDFATRHGLVISGAETDRKSTRLNSSH